MKEILREMKEILREISFGTQNLDFQEIYSIKSHKIKLKIRSDSYSFQSYAQAYLWAEEKWVLIDTIHYSLMKTKPQLYYSVENQGNRSLLTSDFLLDNNFKHFIADRLELIKLVNDILF